MMKKLLLGALTIVIAFTSFSQTEVGRTKYDLQTNNSPGRRIANDASGNITVSFTCSHNASFSDRGSGYNYSSDNGVTWTNGPVEFAAPFVREDLDRTGWPDMVYAGNKEFVISHYSGGVIAGGLSVLSRDIGTTAWTKTTLNSSTASSGASATTYGDAGTWPRAAAKGDSIIVISALYQTNMSGMTGGMIMWRTTDAGANWIGPDTVPLINSSNFVRNGGDNYAIDVNDNGKIAIVLGTYQVEVLTSTDWGDSFTKQTVVATYDDAGNPVPLFDGQTGETLDTVNLSDRSYSVIVDDNDMVHVWFGRSRSFTTIDGVRYSPFAVGLMYWNDAMIEATLINETELTVQQTEICEIVYSTELFDSLSGWGPQVNLYFPSLTSMPSAGYNASGDIFVAYSAIVPATFDDITDLTTPNNYSPDNFHYREIYLMKSSDNGLTWEGPLNVSNETLKECVYPAIPRKIFGTEVPVIWQEDDLPGTNLQKDAPTPPITHPVIDNNIMFEKVAISSIIDPVDFTAPIGALVGPSTLSVLQFGTYTDPGFTISSNCNPLVDTTEVDNVDETTLGSYSYTYTIEDLVGNSITLIRTVTVIAIDDVDPVISLNGNMSETIEACSNWTDLGVTAFDNIDLDLTSSVNTSGSVNLNVVGVYEIEYTVIDAAGNTDTVVRTVTVEDTQGPDITISGASVVYVCKGEAFTPPTASATDCTTSSPSISIDDSGVNTNVNGTYIVEYSSADDIPNTSTKNLIVKVGEAPVPSFTYTQNSNTVYVNNTSTNNPTSSVWDWGDGTTSTVNNHIYTTSGTFTITLTVENEYSTVCGVSEADKSTSQEAIVSSINEINALDASINIQPNPSNGIFTVGINQKGLTNVNISIYDEMANLIIEKTIKNTSINNSLEFDLGEKATGIYFVNITTSQASISKKVLIK